MLGCESQEIKNGKKVLLMLTVLIILCEGVTDYLGAKNVHRMINNLQNIRCVIISLFHFVKMSYSNSSTCPIKYTLYKHNFYYG